MIYNMSLVCKYFFFFFDRNGGSKVLCSVSVDQKLVTDHTLMCLIFSENTKNYGKYSQHFEKVTISDYFPGVTYTLN